MTRLLALYRHAARELDAVRGHGTARSEAIGMVITLSLFAILAIGLAGIGGGA
jgi:nitrate reductase NapE component